MDQVVKRSLKVHNKSLPIQKLVETISKENDFPASSILDRIKMLSLAWQKVTKWQELIIYVVMYQKM